MKYVKILFIALIGILSSCLDSRTVKVEVTLGNAEVGDTVSSLTWEVRIHADSITRSKIKRSTLRGAIDSINKSNLDTVMNGFKTNSNLSREFKKYLKLNYPDYYVTHSLYKFNKKCKHESDTLPEFNNHW